MNLDRFDLLETRNENLEVFRYLNRREDECHRRCRGVERFSEGSSSEEVAPSSSLSNAGTRPHLWFGPPN